MREEKVIKIIIRNGNFRKVADENENARENSHENRGKDVNVSRDMTMIV